MRTARAAAVLVLVLVLQSAIVSELSIFGVAADIVILVPIAAGLTVGPERGAMAGFAAGLSLDLLVQTPFGLTALTYCLVGYGVGAFQSGVLRASRLLPVVAAVVGGALGTFFWAVAATVVGQEGLFNAELPRIVAVVAVVAGLLVLPALRLARWVEEADDRPQLRVAR